MRTLRQKLPFFDCQVHILTENFQLIRNIFTYVYIQRLVTYKIVGGKENAFAWVCSLCHVHLSLCLFRLSTVVCMCCWSRLFLGGKRDYRKSFLTLRSFDRPTRWRQHAFTLLKSKHSLLIKIF